MILRKACSVVAIALVVLLAACQRMVEPTAGIPVEFIFGVFHPAVEPAFVVQPQAEGMRVRGSFWTPCHPYNATAAAEVSEGTLVLRVTGRATRKCPQDVVSGISYLADIQAVSSAYSRLRVIHEWKDANWAPETVIDTTFAPE